MARFLIVDDDSINRELVSAILEGQGHDIEMAATGEDAVRMARESPPDMILMDVMMPGMGGLKAVSLLRSHETTSRIPVVALTALAMPGDREGLLAGGFDAYIEKPISVRTFMQQVQALLSGQAEA